jgi:hypothetical protein
MSRYLLSLLISLVLITESVSADIVYPSSTPSAETTGGTFNQYFTNMFVSGGCTAGKVISGFSSVGVPTCVTGGGGSSYWMSNDAWANIFFTGSSNVGIGTTSPGAQLQIWSPTAWYFTLWEWTGGYKEYWQTESQPRIHLSRDAAASGVAALRFGPGWSTAPDTTIQRLPSWPGVALMGGNIGIGTSSPTQKLTVNGEINYPNGWRLTSAWGADVFTLKKNAWNGSANDNYGAIAAGHGYFYNWLQTGWPTGWEAGDGQLYVWGNSMLMGNVGIGTTSPQAKLHISWLGWQQLLIQWSWPTGNNYIMFNNNWTNLWYIWYGSLGNNWLNLINYQNDKISIGTNSQEMIFIQPSGNVGIGTTAPTGKLDIMGPYADPSLLVNSPASLNLRTGGHVQLAISTQLAWPYTTSLQAKHSTADGNAYPIALNPLGGNVGIGTTSPWVKLDVTTNSDIYGIRVWDASNSQLRIAGTAGGPTGYGLLQTFVGGSTAGGVLSLQRDGWNVGIGTSTPTVKLDVNGYMKATNVVYGENTTKTTTVADWNAWLPSGFYNAYNVNGQPYGSWFHVITSRHSNEWNQYEFQIASDFWQGWKNTYVRTIEASGVQPWRQIITADSAGNVSIGGNIRAGGNVYTDGDYGKWLVWAYASTRYQWVYAMGDAYKLSADGTTPGNLYGITWTHENVGWQSKAWLGHQALFMANGGTQTAIGNGIWTQAAITAVGNIQTSSNIQAAWSPIPANWYNIQWGSVWVSTVYWYNRVCAQNASGDCAGGGWVVMGNENTNAAVSLGSNGAIYASNYYYKSDIRLKKDIKILAWSLEKIEQLHGYTFNWKKDWTSQIWLIAQEVEKIFPQVVNEWKWWDGNEWSYKSVQYGNLVAPIIEAIKELAVTVKTHTIEIDQLRSENRELKKRLDAIEARLSR